MPRSFLSKLNANLQRVYQALEAAPTLVILPDVHATAAAVGPAGTTLAVATGAATLMQPGVPEEAQGQQPVDDDAHSHQQPPPGLGAEEQAAGAASGSQAAAAGVDACSKRGSTEGGAGAAMQPAPDLALPPHSAHLRPHLPGAAPLHAPLQQAYLPAEPRLSGLPAPIPGMPSLTGSSCAGHPGPHGAGSWQQQQQQQQQQHGMWPPISSLQGPQWARHGAGMPGPQWAPHAGAAGSSSLQALRWAPHPGSGGGGGMLQAQQLGHQGGGAVAPPSLLPGLNQPVGALLAGLGLERFLGKLEEEAVDLAALRLMSEAQLRELGLPLGAVVKIKAALANMRLV